MTPYPPNTLCTCTQYTYSHMEGGGGVEPERRGEGQQLKKARSKIQHDGVYLQVINSDKHLPQSPFLGKFFI
jgi:hypothetical protein